MVCFEQFFRRDMIMTKGKNLLACGLATFALCVAGLGEAKGVEPSSGGASGASNAGDTLVVSLQDALKIALSENIQVKIADMEVIKSGYQRKGAYAALFPQIDGNGSYQRTIEKQAMAVGDQVMKFGRDNTYSVGFGLGMPIVNAPLWKSLGISADNVELSIEKAKASKQDMVSEVEQAFYAVLLAEDMYKVYKQNYDNAVVVYEDVKMKYEFGTVAQYDLITAEAKKQNALPDMLDSKNAIEVCLWKLKAIMGVDLNAPIKCVGTLYDYQLQMGSHSTWQDVNLERNTTLKQLNLQSSILYKNYKLKVAQFYPQLNLSASYVWNAMEDNFRFRNYQWHPYSVAGLTLVIPIFSGGSRYYGVKEAKVESEKMAYQIEDTRRNLEVSVRSILNSLNTSFEQYKAAEKSIEGAEKGFLISQKRYDVGSGTMVELSDSRLTLLQARLNLSQSIYSYIVAKSNLDNVMGNNQQKVETLQKELDLQAQEMASVSASESSELQLNK